MANKSRKRIKHEQRVRTAMLERELKALREKQMEYQIIEQYKIVMVRPERDPVRQKAIIEMEAERAVRDMVEQLIRRGVVEVSEERIFDPMFEGTRGYKFTLRALKRR